MSLASLASRAALLSALLLSAVAAFAQSAARPLILNTSYAAQYNNFSGFIGAAITPNANFSVTALGRVYIAGNTGTHTVKILDTATNEDVPGASVQITMTGATESNYQYASLASPVTLSANHNYYLVSQETSGGDGFYDVQPVNGGQGIITGAVSTDNSGNYVVRPNSTWPTPAQISFVGPNMIFTATTPVVPPPTVTITSPVSGQVVAGVFTLTANVNPVIDSSQFSYFQFQLDGQPFVGVNSYGTSPSATVDTSVLLNGAHTLTATYAPPGSTPVASAPVAFSISGGTFPLITSQTVGTLRNNFTGFVGMQFTTGSHILQVTNLGRFVFAGNTQTHTVKLVDAVTGQDVPNGSSSVGTAAATPGQFAFLPSSYYPSLLPNHPYFLLSQETAGGDQWADYGPVITSNITVNGPVYQPPGAAYQYVPIPGDSFVPVNLTFKDLGADAPPIVQITSPPAGALPLAIIAVQGNVSPGTTFSYVYTGQVVIDGKPVGVPAVIVQIAYSPFTGSFSLPFDTTTLSSGPHTLQVQATDDFGLTGISAPVSIQVNNFLGLAMVTSISPTVLRRDFSGYVGMEFTVGATPIQVSSLGRYCVGTGSHVIKLVQVSTAADVPGATGTVNLASCNSAGFTYTQLSSPVTLTAGSAYYLVDQETAGGDFWYDYSPVVTTNAVTVNGAVYSNGGPYVLVQGAPSYSYVPLSLLYTTGTTSPGGLNVTISNIGSNNGINSISLTASSSSAITSIQVLIDGFALMPPLTSAPYLQTLPYVNFGKHVYTAVAKDAAGDTATSAPYTVTTSDFYQYANRYDEVTSTPGPLRNNYTGWVGFQFTTGSIFPLSYNAQELGRACVAGNSQPHTVKIVKASDGTDVPGASIVITCSTALSPGGDNYGGIDNSKLLPNTTYYLVSQETLGGDQFPDIGPAVLIDSMFTIDGPVYFDGQHFVLVPFPNYSYAGVFMNRLVFHD